MSKLLGLSDASANYSASDLLIVIESGYFDPKHYQQEADLNIKSPESLLKHFLAVGEKKGLNPGPLFNTSWYIETYPDIQKASISPLVHFLKYGEKEGRSPCPEEHDALGFSSPNICNQKLWEGFSQYALPKLEELTDSSVRAFRNQANWHLAGWNYVHGETGLALKKLGAIFNELKQGQFFGKRLIISQCKCLFLANRLNDIRAFLNKSEVKDDLLNFSPYLAANIALLVDQDEEGWFTAINQVYAGAGIGLLDKARADAPLSLGNLASPESETKADSFQNPPTVSVIVPAYNAENTIHIALNSLVNQTWKNLEIIVVDDGSEDETSIVVQDFVERYNNIRHIKNDQNQGSYPSRNIGFKNSIGEFVTVHDSDDWSHPLKIEHQIKPLLESNSAVISLSNWARVSENMEFVGSWMLNEEFLEQNISSALIRRETIDKHGMWDEVNVAGDREFLWRLKKIYGLDSVVTVLPEVPLSLALELKSSLTQKKATHVKTVFYGLRWLYREASAWWHNSLDVNSALKMERPFPCPIGNQRVANMVFDAIFAADFSIGNAEIKNVLKELMSLQQKEKLVLFHWPDYRAMKGEHLSPEILELCTESGMTFIEPGHENIAQKVYLYDSGHIAWVPDGLPWQNDTCEVVMLNKN